MREVSRLFKSNLFKRNVVMLFFGRPNLLREAFDSSCLAWRLCLGSNPEVGFVTGGLDINVFAPFFDGPQFFCIFGFQGEMGDSRTVGDDRVLREALWINLGVLQLSIRKLPISDNFHICGKLRTLVFFELIGAWSQ